MAAESKSRALRLWRNARLATMAEGSAGLGIVENGAIAARDGRIVYAGPESELPSTLLRGAETVDCEGRW
ncbi:MAG: imidazolonepropionase, partial [Mesorhizobium sp.]